jgi:hypothetical protein
MITHARRGPGALATAAAITAGCAACALLPSSARPQPSPAATRPRPAACKAAGVAALLPVSPAQLRAAAALAARFAAAYGTHRPGEPPGAWLARLAPMATRPLTGALTRAATTPVAELPGAAESGQVVAEQVRDLTPASVIFTVQVRQTATTTAAGRSTRTDALAVTVTRDGGGWAVYDIEPAAEGDTGAADAAAGQ